LKYVWCSGKIYGDLDRLKLDQGTLQRIIYIRWRVLVEHKMKGDEIKGGQGFPDGPMCHRHRMMSLGRRVNTNGI